MLKFSKIKNIPLIALLIFSLSALADTALDKTDNQNQQKTTNLVELFKVKKQADDHIKQLEKQLQSDKFEIQEPKKKEELLVEYAKTLMYYVNSQDSEPDTSAVTKKALQSKELKSNNLKSKDINSKHTIYNKALTAYKLASKLAIDRNRIKYTRELSELTVKLKKKSALIQIFDELLQHSTHESGTYLAHVDYADGLAKFKDDTANTQFLSAINMRSPKDGVEAYFRYANYLFKTGKPNEALVILNKFDIDERKVYVHVAQLRHKIMHILKLNTDEVDAEIKQIRKELSKSPLIGVGAIPKFIGTVNEFPTNILGIPEAYAWGFSHNNKRDDSRGSFHDWHVYDSIFGWRFSTLVTNMAEVIYNESRGHSQLARYAVGWAIRNRATINMNGCDSYSGAESDPNAGECREETPNGGDNDVADIAKRYSCVVHGGTTSVGSVQSEMDDSHVSMENLEDSGIVWQAVYIINGWVSDPTSYSPLISKYPDDDYYTGSKDGAQEWRSGDYCPVTHHCKERLGNIGGYNYDLATECLNINQEDGNFNDEDIFFWGRKD